MIPKGKKPLEVDVLIRRAHFCSGSRVTERARPGHREADVESHCYPAAALSALLEEDCLLLDRIFSSVQWSRPVLTGSRHCTMLLWPCAQVVPCSRSCCTPCFTRPSSPYPDPIVIAQRPDCGKPHPHLMVTAWGFAAH